MLADKLPCPACNARSLVHPNMISGIAAPQRYRANPEAHVGWHFRIGQSETVRWWCVAAIAGLVMVAEDGLLSGVPQIDEVSDLEDEDEKRAYARADRFLRREWEAIVKAGHRAYYKQVRETPLETVREMWMVTPEFHRLARDIARGSRSWDEYLRTMKDILAASSAAAAGNAAGSPDGVG